MTGKEDSKKELLEEIAKLRERIVELERSDAERTRIEERLREREGRFRAIADYTSDCECWLDSRGKLVWINTAILGLTGYTVDECMAMSDFPLPLVDGEDRYRLGDFFAQAVQGSSGNDVEFRLRRKDGSLLWVSVSWQPIYAADGSSMGHRSSIRDITKRKHAEGALRRSEDLLASIIQFLPDPTFATDRQGRIISWNKAMEEMSGVSADKMLGKGDHEYAIPFYGERRPTLADLLFRWDDDIAKQYSFIKKDGDFLYGETDSACVSYGRGRTVWVKAGPLRNGEGDIVGAIESVRDITDRKETEASLREAKEYTENLIKSANVLIVGLDPAGNVTLFNETAENVTGYKAHEIIGKNWFELMVPNTTYGRARDDFSGLKSGDSRSGTFENPIMTKSGEERIIFWKNSVLRQHGQFVGTISFGTDVTDQRRAEDALREAHDELERRVEERTRQLTEAYENLRRETEKRKKMEDHVRQGQKLEALGTLAGGIAHDFNNVLAAIIGFTEMVLEDVDPNGPEHRRLELVLKGAKRGRDLVKQILIFSRHAEQDRKPLILSDTIEEALKLLRPILPSTIEIVWKGSEGDDTILADPVHIQQILMNLCTNAAYAMQGKGGILHLGISHVVLTGSDQASEPETIPGEYVVLEVRDTGTGMDPETLERIFDPFFTTKKQGEGTGLGLSVVHGIVKSFGGHIAVESEPGKGTSFRVYLPRADERRYTGGKYRSTPIAGGKERILLVDDEDIMITLDEERLTGLGYEVAATTSSQEALEIFRKTPDRFDLVITDYTMPNLTGIDLAGELLKVKPTIPIILWTGYNEAVSRERVQKAGIKAFLMKPSDRNTLAETIRRVLDTETEERRG